MIYDMARIGMTRRFMTAVSVAAMAGSLVMAHPATAQTVDTDNSVDILPSSHAPVSARPLLVANVTPAQPTPPAPAATQPAPAAAPAPQPMPPPPGADPSSNDDPAAYPGQGAPGTPTVTAEDRDPRALSDFSPQLDPYGSWVEDEKYGRVWVPSRAIVGDNFAPYVSSGHWAMDTGNNWVWVSDFTFGDVVFHYGRWVWTSYGWSWVPGYQYAPAWVAWRTPTSRYEYVGWAPVPPTYVWFGGAAIGYGYGYSPYYWAFCPSAFVFAPYPYAYIVTHPLYVRSIYRYTRVYSPASPRLGFGPTFAAARVPRQAWPSQRIAATPHLAARASIGASGRAGIAAGGRFDTAARSLPTSRTPISPAGAGRFNERALAGVPPSRTGMPVTRANGMRETLPPGRLVPPSRFDAPARSPGPSNGFGDARSWPAPRTFDAARPSSPYRFDAPSRGSSFPTHSYSPSRPMAPERYNGSHSFSPSFSPSHSYSPSRSYSPPPMRSAPSSPHFSPPPMRSAPHGRR
jgi:hypothetical protein